jgi:2-dehydropantoate 2-reductase
MWEVVAVAARHGVTLTAGDVDEMAAPNAELRDYHPSTARDLAAGKPLERDALCGFLAREGARQGIPTPVNAVLDGLLALQEDRARGRQEVPRTP